MSLVGVAPRRFCRIAPRFSARVAKLVDARDLKSLGEKSLCRFESGRPHQSSIRAEGLLPMPPFGCRHDSTLEPLLPESIDCESMCAAEAACMNP